MPDDVTLEGISQLLEHVARTRSQDQSRFCNEPGAPRLYRRDKLDAALTLVRDMKPASQQTATLRSVQRHRSTDTRNERLAISAKSRATGELGRASSALTSLGPLCAPATRPCAIFFPKTVKLHALQFRATSAAMPFDHFGFGASLGAGIALVLGELAQHHASAEAFAHLAHCLVVGFVGFIGHGIPRWLTCRA
jgi:hypothetical protein